MSSRLTFYEVRRGDEYDWDHVCLCKKEEDAQRIANTEENLSGKKHHVAQMEIYAQVDLTCDDYF